MGGRGKADEREEHDLKKSRGKGLGRKKMLRGRNYEESNGQSRRDKRDRTQKERSREMGIDNGGDSGQGGNLRKGRRDGKWRLGVDEDLTMGERRLRWRIVEAAKRKRAKGKKVVVTNRVMCRE